MEMDVSFAKEACQDLKGVYRKLGSTRKLRFRIFDIG